MASGALDVALRSSSRRSDGRSCWLAENAPRQRIANDRGLALSPNTPAGLNWRRCPRSPCHADALIGVVGIDRIDPSAPAGVKVFEQLLGRCPSGPGDSEKRVDEMRLVLAGRVASRSAMQSLSRHL